MAKRKKTTQIDLLRESLKRLETPKKVKTWYDDGTVETIYYNKDGSMSRKTEVKK